MQRRGAWLVLVVVFEGGYHGRFAGDEVPGGVERAGPVSTRVALGPLLGVRGRVVRTFVIFSILGGAPRTSRPSRAPVAPWRVLVHWRPRGGSAPLTRPLEVARGGLMRVDLLRT